MSSQIKRCLSLALLLISTASVDAGGDEFTPLEASPTYTGLISADCIASEANSPYDLNIGSNSGGSGSSGSGR